MHENDEQNIADLPDAPHSFMSESPKCVNVSFDAAVDLSTGLKRDITAGHTGRTVRDNDNYRLVQEWAQLTMRHELIAHNAFETLRSEVLFKEVPLLLDGSLVWLRGRICGCPPKSENMGPPPLDKKISEGRYNKADESVLYLSESVGGVRRELAAWNGRGTPYGQEYCIPAQQLHIADFAVLPGDSFLTAVFFKAEECRVAGRGPDSYMFSQAVSEVVKEKFDGMRIPGARGDRGVRYSNLVLFRPHPQWHSWLKPSSEPFRLDQSSESDWDLVRRSCHGQ